MKRIGNTVVAIIFAAVCIPAVILPMAKASEDVIVLQHYHFYTPPATAMNISIGAIYWVMGEVKNVGDAPATNITVTANFYDDSDNFINSTKTSIQPLVGFPDANVLMPGQKAPLFSMQLDEKSGAKSVDHYNLAVTFSLLHQFSQCCFLRLIK